MSIDNDALQLLCERVEGNLLAAVQEVEKLKLLATDGRITARTVSAAVSDNARYNVFEMTDNALRGDASASLRMLHGLRAEGSEPPVVLWALAKEIRALYAAKLDCDRGQSAQQALASAGAGPPQHVCGRSPVVVDFLSASRLVVSVRVVSISSCSIE